MNPHFHHPPPPGLVHYYPVNPPWPHPHAIPQHQRYVAPGASLNAQPYPQFHNREHTITSYPVHQNYPSDANGWHSSAKPHNQSPPVSAPHTPLHPPGLALPTHTHSLKSHAEGDVSRSHMQEFWAGRLAPLPGYQSSLTLLPMRKTVLNSGTKMPKKHEALTPALELLPPQSYLINSHERNGSLTTIHSSPTLVGEDINLEFGISKSQTVSPTMKTNKTENEQKKVSEFVLDKYAESFVPQYLYNIQREPHPLKPLPAIPVFPPISYLNLFLIPDLINKTGDTPSLLLAPPPAEGETSAPLDVSTYSAHWADVLRWELDAIARDKERIVLWKRGIKVAMWKDSEFMFTVPGIRENYPYLEVGDIVHLREVFVEEHRGTMRALEGRVTALRKQEGLVYIFSSPLKEHVQTYVPLSLDNIKTENGFVVFSEGETVPFVFNISFMTNARPLCVMQDAVDTVAHMLSSKSQGMNLARQWIFPEVEDVNTLPCDMLGDGEIKETEWKDPGLNIEQRLAVTFVAKYQYPVPRLISGPPGTGKTRTVVESVLQIFRLQPEACILVCAPSNPATDTLVLRLQKHLQRHEMLRLNAPNRTFAEVPDTIMPYCYIENNKFSLPPWKQLLNYRVVVTSCLDAGILVSVHCTNSILMKLENQVTASLHPHRLPKHVTQPHWTHLLIDEAAQGSEPELLVPISVVLSDVCGADIQGQTFVPQLALCGDINQLGPNVFSEEARNAELEVSLLERLFERPLYSNHLREVEQQLNGGILRLSPYTRLVKNYRSHPIILMPPSALFYNDSLHPFALTNGKISWPGLSDQALPLKFIGTDAEDKSNDDRASWFNPGQIDIIVDVIKSLLANSRQSQPELHAREIGVMAPWRQQVWKLRKRLRNEGLYAVDVGTVEDYQGRETRVVILSCVRSSERFLEEDHKKAMGLILQKKRLNVAITRAKELLVVVGKGSLLKRDPYWKSFLQFCIRNGLYEGPDLSLELDGNYISRLESQLILSGKIHLDPEVAGLMIAGEVAREALN